MNEIIQESVSVSTSTDDRYTPTASIISDAASIKDDGSFTLPPEFVEHHPKVGEQCLLRERKQPHRIVSLHFGVLKLLDRPYAGAGYLWLCAKNNGWYGFQNVGSGMWLGHACGGRIWATQPRHRGDEYFMAERHEDGGYVLLMRHGDVLRQVAISDDGQGLVEREPSEGTGTAWDFIAV